MTSPSFTKMSRVQGDGPVSKVPAKQAQRIEQRCPLPYKKHDIFAYAYNQLMGKRQSQEIPQISLANQSNLVDELEVLVLKNRSEEF